MTGCNGQAAPAAPTNLAVTTNPTGTLRDGHLGRTGLGRRQPGHRVHRSRSGAAPESLSPATFIKTWTGLTPGANYLFSVPATNAIGTGVAASQSVTMPNPTAPAAPGALSVVADPVAQTAHVTWNAPASDGGLPISSYDVLVDGALSTSGAGRDLTLPGFGRGSDAHGVGPRPEPDRRGTGGNRHGQRRDHARRPADRRPRRQEGRQEDRLGLLDGAGDRRAAPVTGYHGVVYKAKTASS